MIIAKVIAGVQVIGLCIWGYASNQITGIHDVVHKLEQADAKLETRITVIEGRLK